MTVAIVKVIARGPQGPAGTGGSGSSTLAQILANGHDANAVEITNGATPTTDSSLDTRGARNTAIAALSTVYQPLDSDLTAIAALTTTSFGRAVLALADAAALRTAAGLGTAAVAATGDFDTAGAAAAAQAASQPLDSDLTAIAALNTTSFGRAFLALADAAAGRTALGLGTLATQSGTFSGTSSGTNTGDQTTVSGNAGTAAALQTARAIDGQSFDGTAAITVIAPGTHAATGKTTPVDADEIPLVDSAASNVLKKLTWANLKATLKTYFDTLYAAISHTHAAADIASGTIAQARLGTGSGGAGTKVLYDDQTYKTPSASSGSVATDTIWDAKGDLAAGTGGDTASRLAVGSNNQVLTADSAQTAGVKWADAYLAGGTDVAVADGGTGSSTASGARTNLGLVIGTDVEAHDADLTTIGGLSPSNDDVLQRKAGAWANRTIAQLLSDLGVLASTQSPMIQAVPYTFQGTAQSNPGANVAVAVPFFTPVKVTVNRILLRITTSSGNMDVGIYNSDDTSGLPGSKVVSTGSFAAPTAGQTSVTISSTVLAPGYYWICFAADNGTIQIRSIPSDIIVGSTTFQMRTKASSFPLPSSIASSAASSGLFYILIPAGV